MVPSLVDFIQVIFFSFVVAVVTFHCCHYFIITGGTGLKVDPIVGHEGQVGERRYSSSLSLTLVLDRLGGQR